MYDTLKNKYSLPWRFKKSWIKALKSHDYVQGRGTLRNKMSNTYCCLGVACAIAGMDKRQIDGEYIPYDETLPVPLTLMGGTTNELVRALSSMNDSLGENVSFNFEEIADWIDDNIKATR
jgi:hypothetical protein